MEPLIDDTVQANQNPLVTKFQYLVKLIEGQGQILEMIAGGEDLNHILDAIILWAEKESAGDVFAAIRLYNEETGRWNFASAPSLPTAFKNAINGFAAQEGKDACGTIVFTIGDITVEDIDTDPNWAGCREIAADHGLKSCWSIPLTGKRGKRLGSFVMYLRQNLQPSGHDLQIMKLISSTAVIAIEWGRTEQERNRLLENERSAALNIQKEREDFYNLLMNAPAMVALLKGPGHVFELANPLYMEAIGHRPSIIGKTAREALPELKGQGIFEVLDEVYETGEAHYGTELLLQIHKKGGTELVDTYFNFVYQPLRDKNGKTEAIFVHAVDVTELVKAKKRAEESEEMFRSFVLNSPMPIGIYIGKEMRVQTANDAILQAWEKDRSVIGKTFREALPELEGQPFYQLLDDVYTTGITYQATEDKVDLYRDGKITPTYWSFTYKALRNESGKIYGVINTGTEVTELVQAKQRVIDAQGTMQAAIDIAELGTWSIDLQTNFITYSESVAEWFGLPLEGAGNNAVMLSIHEDDRTVVDNAVQRAIDTGGVYEAEYRVVSPLTGRERIIQAKGKCLMDPNGVKTTLNGVCRDITLQKETQQELEMQVQHRTLELRQINEELNMVNENLKQFVYVASHDLQEPLRKINIFSDLLKKRNTELDEVSKSYLSKITTASMRMTNLIKDLLEFSRVEGNDRTFMDTDLNQVLQNVILDYDLLLQNKSGKVVALDLPTIKGIPLQLNQLFYNLLGNSLKFSRDNVPPVVNISYRVMPVDEVASYETLNPNWPYVSINMTDNGIGFQQKFADQIFDIFQRLHRKEEFEGTGIGLALCKKIVENHNGILFAEGRENEGATFHIIIPLTRIDTNR